MLQSVLIKQETAEWLHYANVYSSFNQNRNRITAQSISTKIIHYDDV